MMGLTGVEVARRTELNPAWVSSPAQRAMPAWFPAPPILVSAAARPANGSSAQTRCAGTSHLDIVRLYAGRATHTAV